MIETNAVPDDWCMVHGRGARVQRWITSAVQVAGVSPSWWECPQCQKAAASSAAPLPNTELKEALIGEIFDRLNKATTDDGGVFFHDWKDLGTPFFLRFARAIEAATTWQWMDRIMEDTRDLEYHAKENARVLSDNERLRDKWESADRHINNLEVEISRLREYILTPEEAQSVLGYISTGYISGDSATITAKLRSLSEKE